VAGLVVALGACTPTVRVEAPKEPIRLSIDLNIKHELKVKIEESVDALQTRTAVPADKRAGWIGERLDGYLGFVRADVPPEVRELAILANEERLAEYDRLAQENQLHRHAVEAISGRRLIARSAPGAWVMAKNRSWTRKP